MSQIDNSNDSGFYLTTKNGALAYVRPVMPNDKVLLKEGMDKASAETLYRRFFKPISRLNNQQLQYLTEVDQLNHVAWGIFRVDETEWVAVGIGRFVRTPEDDKIAEFALTTIDAHQNKGFGTLLMLLLLALAQSLQIETLRGYILADNASMLHLAGKFGAVMIPEESSLLRADITIHDVHQLIHNHPTWAETWQHIQQNIIL